MILPTSCGAGTTANTVSHHGNLQQPGFGEGARLKATLAGCSFFFSRRLLRHVSCGATRGGGAGVVSAPFWDGTKPLSTEPAGIFAGRSAAVDLGYFAQWGGKPPRAPSSSTRRIRESMSKIRVGRQEKITR